MLIRASERAGKTPEEEAVLPSLFVQFFPDAAFPCVADIP